MSFRTAVIGGGEAPLRVIHDISGAAWDFRFTRNSDWAAALQ